MNLSPLHDYPPMFSTTIEQRRATLTLLDHGAVLGVPEGVSPADADRERERVNGWLAEGASGTLALPWPVDVTDLRGQMYERTK